MRAGKLRHRLDVQVPAEGRGTTGGVTTSWSTEATVSASIEPLSGREQITALQVQSRITHRITLRHYPGLTSHHRLKEGTRTFHIVSATNADERNRMTVVMAEERVDTP